MENKELIERLRIDAEWAEGQEWETPICLWDDLREAISALRAQQESEKNDPLTLAELREMDGEPVWICDPGGSDGMWALVDLEYELCRTAQGGIAIFDTYGKTWLAYRREPEKGAI